MDRPSGVSLADMQFLEVTCSLGRVWQELCPLAGPGQDSPYVCVCVGGKSQAQFGLRSQEEQAQVCSLPRDQLGVGRDSEVSGPVA